MYEQIMAALEEALKAKDTEIKYWRDRNAVLAGENEALRAENEQAMRQLGEMAKLQAKHADEIHALEEDKAMLLQEVADLKRLRQETPVTLEQVEKLLEKHSGGNTAKEAENGGGADPYWEPRG